MVIKSVILLTSVLLTGTIGLPTSKISGNYDRSEELAGYFEGDIELTPDQQNALDGKIEGLNGLQSLTTRWTNKIVAYTISPDFNQDQKNYIRRGLDTLELSTCLKFVERTNERDFINVVPSESGCSSSVGKRGGEQFLRLLPNTIENGCFRLATVSYC